ncbi:MAG: GH1 family beta-glucosidase [Acidimicrobiales bacterium]
MTTPVPPDTAPRRFPEGFRWGTATSSYQIEGAHDVDGKSESIWDRFCTQPGVIADGSDGTVACDHYHRYDHDVAMMADMGLGAYRFSIAWPRVLPGGTGPINQAGLDFYDRLVDRLLEAGIEPHPTLYHWDLPQVLEDRGGWPVRATAEAFAEYASAVAERLGDRVKNWMTINEPWVIANLGYLTGEHAPGRSSLSDALAASHHILLAHGLGMQAVRAAVPDANVGIVLNFTPVTRIGDSPAALERQQLIDEYDNRWYSDPLGGRGYPAFATERLAWDQAEVLDGDLDLIAQPIDVLGINYYTRQLIGAFFGEKQGRGAETAMKWEIHPPSLGKLLNDLHERHGFPRIMITENGAAMADHDRIGDRIDDADRIDYLARHLNQVADAIDRGVPIDGYFAWSLLDNFEWAWGYGPTFGLVEVDLETQQRRPKASAGWYAAVASANAVEPWHEPTA